MPKPLQISHAQITDKGCKEINQDFHGVLIPKEPLLSTKGIAIALADGISSSQVSQVASQTAVTGFLEDYFCTSEAWSVKKSALRVLTAMNSWLYFQTRKSRYRYDMDRGYVCTFSAMVIKSSTAHLFHTGDSRIYRLQDNGLEQLTQDHRIWVSRTESYLKRALGGQPQLELDYTAVPIEVGDTFIVVTDGIYEYTSDKNIIDSINRNSENLDKAARNIVDLALDNGSKDNLTLQIIRIENLPGINAGELIKRFNTLPFPPVLEARNTFDGYKIIREIHASSRSHVYLAIDSETDLQVVLKIPSVDLRGDSEYLERFLLEEWIARRINNPYVLKPVPHTRKQNYVYIVTEYIQGQTLSQWMIDNPRPRLEAVRNIIEQIASGLRAFHRLEMLHQDLRPANIMIDLTGTAKIIDFGSTSVAGLKEMTDNPNQEKILGTVQYTAPEYFVGDPVTSRSDLFSLAAIMYEMLTGKLPYGTRLAKVRTRADQRKLDCEPVCTLRTDIPVWVDEAILKALQPDPRRRYEDLSEFIFDLRHPNKAFENRTRPPLLERNPVAFWRGLSAVLAIVVVILLHRILTP